MGSRTGAVSIYENNVATDGDVDMTITENTFKGGNGRTFVGSENTAGWDTGATIKNNTFTDAGDIDVGVKNKAGRYVHMDYHCNKLYGARDGLRMGTGNRAGRDSRSTISSNFIG